jgi:hypothetical protein
MINGVTTLDDDEVVPFNTIINNQSAEMSLNASTGEITVTETGNYYISWWITVDGSTANPFITFSLEVDSNVHSNTSTPLLTSQLSGSELVTISTAPAVITLVNVTGNTIFLSQLDNQANLVILKIS